MAVITREALEACVEAGTKFGFHNLRATAVLLHDGTYEVPIRVSAAIPNEVSRCKITSYGIRVKTLMRNAEIYPDLLHSSCTPIKTIVN